MPVPQPSVVAKYNKYMEGMNRMDQEMIVTIVPVLLYNSIAGIQSIRSWTTLHLGYRRQIAKVHLKRYGSANESTNTFMIAEFWLTISRISIYK